MFNTGLFIVTKPLNQIRKNIPVYLSEINRLVSETAYIHIQPNSDRESLLVGKLQLDQLPFSHEIRHIIKEFYSKSSSQCGHRVDIRVLLGHVTNSANNIKRYELKKPCDVVVIDEQIKKEFHVDLKKSVEGLFSVQKDFSLECFLLNNSDSDATAGVSQDGANERIQQHENTCLGGTFDRIHTGHKLMLTEGCLLANKSLTVGVTDSNMTAKKTLRELILPVERRIADVQDFVEDVKPGLEYKIVPIADIYGPTIVDPDLDLLVLSLETKKGGEMVKVEREKKGLKQMSEYTIELVEDSCRNQYEEEKVSSSSQRKRLLGSLLHPVKESVDPSKRPYIIGLTGGIASGKSSISKRLQGQGAAIVDCDKLGHKAYLKGTPGFTKVVEGFGPEVVGEDGEINRKVLGSKVFGNKAELEKLNQIVWPEIAKLAQDQIAEYAKEGHDVVVLDAAVLLEASWDEMCEEIWVTFVPADEAIKRIMERNKLSEEQAQKRIDSQLSNAVRVSKANVVLCSLWEYEYTQIQVEKAWSLLLKRIGTTTKPVNSSKI